MIIYCLKVKVLVPQSCPTLWDPMDCSHQAPLSLRLSRQEYWSELSFPSPGVLPDLGTEPTSLVSPALQADSLPSEPPGKHVYCLQFSSVAQSCPTLCDPMNHSTPGFPVYHHLPEFTQIHIHRVSDAIQPAHPLLFSSPPDPNPSQHQSLFQ